MTVASAPVWCRNCGLGPLSPPRSKQARLFCSSACRTDWHNERRQRAEALLDLHSDFLDAISFALDRLVAEPTETRRKIEKLQRVLESIPSKFLPTSSESTR